MKESKSFTETDYDKLKFPLIEIEKHNFNIGGF